jgi:hypothetical protein
MPTGKMFMHPTIGSLFIDADDGKYYQPRPEVTLAPDTRVTFEVLNLTGAPPGFYFASNVQEVPAQTASKSLGSWGKPLPPSITTPTTVAPVTPVDNRGPSVSPALPVPNAAVPRTLTERQTREDFEAIARKVDEIAWGANKGFGPSLTVTTKLKWEGEGIELYMRVLEEYQDKKIPGTKMYFYVGTMGVNFGKGGFRISAHTHPKANIAKSTTYTVLHVEN